MEYQNHLLLSASGIFTLHLLAAEQSALVVNDVGTKTKGVTVNPGDSR
jgi:hypothetical protein